MGQIIGIIVSSLIILYVWTWLLSTVFGPRALQKKLLINILVMGVLIVGILFAYTYATSKFVFGPRSIVEHFSLENGLRFVGYCVIGIWLIFLLFHKWALKILEIIGIWALLFVAIHLWGVFLGIQSMILYYVLSAYAEEYMKYSWSHIVFKGNDNIKNSLIFFCVLMGLGFSLVENIVYLATVIANHQNINLWGFVLGRWLISALVHVTATSAIGFVATKFDGKLQLLITTIIGIVSWVALHSIYNLSLTWNLWYITLPLVIILFFLMSYFLFQSDILYLPADKDPKPNT